MIKTKMKKANPSDTKHRAEQLVTDLCLYLLLDGAVSYLFYRSIAAFLVLLPGFVLFRRKQHQKRRREEAKVLESQFLSALQLLGVSLSAGYVSENAFRDAFRELKRMYPENAPVLKLFGRVIAGMELNRPLDTLLMEAAQSCDVEDIQSFAEVFYTAKRSGGDMIQIVQNTGQAILRKEETLKEMEAALAGKQMEQKMMSFIPLFILGYVSLTSPGFLDVCYHNLAGIVIMTICLAVYLAAYLWAGKIMEVTV